MYTRFLDPDARKGFFSAYKEIEALWEILSPSAELRDHIDTFRRLTHLYAVVRNAYADRPDFLADLAHKTQQLVEESAAMHDLGNLTKSVTFDLRTLSALQKESGPDEAKVFNLVRGLQTEVESEPELESVLRPLKERAESVLKGLEERTTTGLAAMGHLGVPRQGEGGSSRRRTRQHAASKGFRRLLDTKGRRSPQSGRSERDGVRGRGP